MDTQNTDSIRMPTPRRKRRSKLQIFKEAYLPTIILAVTAVLVLVFIIGGIVNRGDPQLSNPSAGTSSGDKTDPTPSQPAGSQGDPALAQEAEDLLAQAEVLAVDYDYAGAVAVLESFSGIKEDFPLLASAIEYYKAADQALVSWDAEDVYNLSFHVLIADPQLAFADSVYGSNGTGSNKNLYKKNFITVTEFNNILQQLYSNGYILVDLDDFYSLEEDSTTGTQVYVQKQLRLPIGKKPVMLTEMSASYYAYMQTGAGDGTADGFASRLAHDGQRFYNEMFNADDSISTGSYDMVPLLEDFIAAHPDFSYRGARAVISFAGYDRILGYRINDSSLSADALQAERDGLKATVEALKAAGYKLACYTYNNVNYTSMSAQEIQNDIKKWEDRVTPWLGEVDILVFAREGDIGTEDPYTGSSKFNVLYNAGFRFFLGSGNTPWSQVADRYVRHNRLIITGLYLQEHPERFEALFDASSVLDDARS